MTCICGHSFSWIIATEEAQKEKAKAKKEYNLGQYTLVDVHARSLGDSCQ